MAFNEFLLTLSELGESHISDKATFELLTTGVILILGFGFAKVLSRILSSIARRRAVKRGLTHGSESLIKLVRYSIMSLTMVAVLIYLQTTSVEGISSVYSQLPALLSLLLIIILGITLIQVISQLLESLLQKIGVTEYLAMYNREYLLEPTMVGVRVVLSFFLIEVVLAYIGFRFTPASTLMVVALYMGILALGILAVFGLRNQAENFFAMMYLTSLEYFKVGHLITFEGKKGEIREITPLHTEIALDSNVVLLVPNKKLASSELTFERKHIELDTLEKIKRYYVAQEPSHCGPAAAEIVLRVFGFNFDQQKIGKLCGTKIGLGTKPEVLIEVVEELARKTVLGAWINFDAITKLDDELEAWLNQGALAILDYKKDFLFKKNPTAHYMVCLGVKDNELLILDPSSKYGGVYLVNYKKIELGMNTISRLTKKKRGYIVLAPKGTEAYWRLKKNLIYSDLGLYEGLSKTVETQLIKLLKKKRFKDIIPGFVKKYLKHWEKSEDTIYRLWHPDEEKVKLKPVSKT